MGRARSRGVWAIVAVGPAVPIVVAVAVPIVVAIAVPIVVAMAVPIVVAVAVPIVVAVAVVRAIAFVIAATIPVASVRGVVISIALSKPDPLSIMVVAFVEVPAGRLAAGRRQRRHSILLTAQRAEGLLPVRLAVAVVAPPITRVIPAQRHPTIFDMKLGAPIVPAYGRPPLAHPQLPTVIIGSSRGPSVIASIASLGPFTAAVVRAPVVVAFLPLALDRGA